MTDHILGFQQSVKEAKDTWAIYKNNNSDPDMIPIKVEFWVFATTLCASVDEPMTFVNAMVRSYKDGLIELTKDYVRCPERGGQIAGVMAYMANQKEKPTQKQMLEFISND